MKPKAIIVSGYFNPLHRGHIELFHNAKSKGDKLFVIVNNDIQRELKGSKEFMLEDERVLIVSQISIVDKVFLSVDQDRTVIKSIEEINNADGKEYELYFANGGDQNNQVCPEAKICRKLGINLIDGLGNKIQSSSWLLKIFVALEQVMLEDLPWLLLL
jgi:cytidyltransferase-like protein